MRSVMPAAGESRASIVAVAEPVRRDSSAQRNRWVARQLLRGLSKGIECIAEPFFFNGGNTVLRQRNRIGLPRLRRHGGNQQDLRARGREHPAAEKP